MPHLLRIFAVFATALVIQAGPAMAQPVGMIWSGVVFATNAETPASPAVELVPFLEKLKSVFGYNQFEIVGRHVEPMDQPVERWLVPSKIFCLRVNSRRAAARGYLLKLQLYQRTKMLTEFEAQITSKNPLVIRGPLCGNGQLLFVLMVQ